MEEKIARLVFAGALVRNAAYAGGLLALQELGYLEHVEAYAGVSSGAIVATLCAVGYTPMEVRQAILALDFSKLPDGDWLSPLRVLSRFGWHRGTYLENQLQALIAEKTGLPQATFGEVQRLTGRDLRIVGTDLCTREATVFSPGTTADFPVAQAVRISMAVPVVFAANEFDGHAHVDGGVVWNYPIDIFDGKVPGPLRTLGFRVVSANRETRIGSLGDCVHALFSSVLRAQQVLLERNPQDLARTIDLPDMGIPGANFNLTRADKESLIAAGKAATLKRFAEALIFQ